jgi:RNA polymerase sigma-70 factor, ECF subfamily
VADLSALRKTECELLFESHAEALWRAIYVYCGGRRDLADDAVGSAFLAALESHDDISDLRSWIYKVAFRTAAHHMKMERRLPPASMLSDPLAPEEIFDLLDALQSLPRKQRAVAVLYYRIGMTTTEIAEILSTSNSTVRVHLHRARRTLRERLRNHD